MEIKFKVQKQKLKKLFCIFLAMLMLMGTISGALGVSAAEDNILLLNVEKEITLYDTGEMTEVYFTAETTGTYRFSFTGTPMFMNIVDCYNCGIWDDSEEHDIELTGDTTYCIQLTNCDGEPQKTATIKVGLQTADDGTDEGNMPEYTDIYADELWNIESDNNVYFRFIPEESGYYSFCSDSDSDPGCTLYDDQMKSITSEDDSIGYDFELDYYLEAGKTYYYLVEFYSFETYCKVTLTYSGEGDDVTDGNVPDNELEYEDIYVGDTKSGDSVSDQYFRFIPETSGAYCFYSESDGETSAELYDADLNLLASGDSIYSDDDSCNFNLKYYEFEAGETYYFKVNLWYYNTFCDIKLISVLTPVSISFEPVKSFDFTEKISAVLNYDENDNEFFCYDVSFSKDDMLIVKYNDESTKAFKYEPAEYGWLSGKFIASDGEVLTEFALSTDQTDELWSAGTYDATVSYAGKTCTVPVVINECPVETLSAEYKHTLYENYDCELGAYESSDWNKYINSEDIIYTLKMKDGTEISGDSNVIISELDRIPDYSIRLNKVGTNEGKVNIGALEGVFKANIETYPADIAEQPQCIINSSQLDFYKGENIDFQLIDFADKGQIHTVKIQEIPEWLTLDNNGRLTGVVPEGHGYKNLRFDVRWNDSYAHYIGDIEINITHKLSVPDNVEVIPYDTVVDIIASEDEPKWFKFRSYSDYVNVNGKKSDKEDDWDSMDFELYDSKGIFVTGGFGDSGDGFLWGGYPVKRGEYYYLCIKDSGEIKINIPEWLPEWTDSGNKPNTSNEELVATNIQKTFDGDINASWNVYSINVEYDIDFDGGFTYDEFGSLNRIASPVNIYTETTNITSNLEVIYTRSYKYDPNNAEECERIGASTTQNTMKNELREGEKEYRFDNVYYFIPEIGKLELCEERLVYVPVGYYIKDSHVIKCTEHIDKAVSRENIISNTCVQNGSYEEVTYCPVCDQELSRETKVVPKSGHKFCEWTVSVYPTCDENGVEYRVCSECKEYEDRNIDMLTHKDDNNDGECDNCNELLQEQEQNIGFLAKIKAFIQKIIDWIRSLFKR